MLKFNNAWRFHPPSSLDYNITNDFSELIGKVASQGDRQYVLEHFKDYFANAAGTTSTWSSSTSWAESDLDSHMTSAAKNAPLFIAAFYDACQALQTKEPEFHLPAVGMMNAILQEHGVDFTIQPPNLVARSVLPTMIAVPARPPSLDEQAQEIIPQSLHQSEQLLSEGRNRQAVQEILWLLETVSTAFQGLNTESGTVQEKYFNKIADDLRKKNKGKMLEQVFDWIKTLHGYLSSPTGGGIRHGADVKNLQAPQQNDARLICNLIRSYITYLMAEHERLSKRQRATE